MPRLYTRKNKKGGVISKLNVNSINTLNLWNIYYIAAHGQLMNRIKQVPKNTYILFLAPSGGMCSTTNELRKMLTDDTYNMLYTSITNNKKSFLKLYNSEKEPSYNDTTTLGIYEPGDNYYDMFLNFENIMEYGFMDMGLYKFPVNNTLFTFAEETQHMFKQQLLNSISGKISKTKNEMEQFIKDNNQTMLLRNDEILTPYIKRSIINNKPKALHLSQILESLNEVKSDNTRLFVINACRVTKSINLSKQTRRLSLNQRKIHKL